MLSQPPTPAISWFIFFPPPPHSFFWSLFLFPTPFKDCGGTHYLMVAFPPHFPPPFYMFPSGSLFQGVLERSVGRPRALFTFPSIPFLPSGASCFLELDVLPPYANPKTIEPVGKMELSARPPPPFFFFFPVFFLFFCFFYVFSTSFCPFSTSRSPPPFPPMARLFFLSVRFLRLPDPSISVFIPSIIVRLEPFRTFSVHLLNARLANLASFFGAVPFFFFVFFPPNSRPALS